jgi:glucose dehydrogenase
MMDQVVLAMNSGNFYLKTIDSATGKQLKQVALGAATTITPSALTTVGTQISVLITKSTGISVLQLRDNTTLALVKTLTLPK